MIARAPMDEFSNRVDYYRSRVNEQLTRALAGNDMPSKLREAMRYSVLGEGKRVRPLLAYASGEMCGLGQEQCDSIASSVELVHAYSLVHDDLPAMDDDDLRRGKPTTHRAYDEATAILAGDALQALAFEVLCDDPALQADPAAQARVIAWLARAIGPSGMVGGQALDLEAENRSVEEAELEDIHRRKTGQLIRAAIMMPSELGDMPTESRDRLDEFARNIGLVFQIRDDLLEVEQDTATLGKSAASDAENNKSTYPAVVGLDRARELAHEAVDEALESLACFGNEADTFRALARFVVEREA